MNYKRCLAALQALVCLWLIGGLAGCSSLVEKKAVGVAEGFVAAVRNNDDPAVVAQGLPSYLLMLDALVNGNPGKPVLWQAASSLNSAYAGSFVRDPESSRRLHAKAMNYAFRALCLRDARLCDPRSLPRDRLQQIIAGFGRQDAGILYAAGGAWAGWIQSHADDWSAVADLSRVEALMQRVVELDDGYEKGMPHLYLGVLATVLTPALGGRPEEGRVQFERAIALSDGKNLSAKVYYAKQYARGVFDRELHDRLLNQVVAAEPRADGFTLANILAQAEAKALLQSADDYF